MVRISTSQFWVELAVPVTHLYSYISKIKAVTEISNYYMSTRGMRFFLLSRISIRSMPFCLPHLPLTA